MDDQENHLREFGDRIVRLMRGENLSREEIRDSWRQICLATQPDLQQGALLAAMRTKPETPEEVAGVFDALYEYDTLKVDVSTPEPLIDNAGTGADTLKTFNISTGAAIVAAACGQYVVRNAARAISSHCGAIDVIEALGVNVESAPELPKQSLERAGICTWNGLLTSLHPKTLPRLLSQIRFGSTINLVGPLLNPTMPEYKVMGVSSLDILDVEIQVLRELGFRGAFVMHGLEEKTELGMDELSTLGPSHIAELSEDGGVHRYVITPAELGLKQARFEELASSHNVQQDALDLLRVLVGKDDGPRCDIVCLNAAAMLYIMGKVDNLRAGVERARETIATGQALETLRRWVSWQNATPTHGLSILEPMVEQVT